MKFNLFRLEKYTGCVSCFGCKKEKYKGYCICKDGLTEVLDAIREADGLIIGSPNYLGELTASFRALYERLIFQNLTYNTEVPCCNENPTPTLLIMTSNAPDNAFMPLLQNYKDVFDRFVGSCEIFVSGETLQLRITAKPTGHGSSMPKRDMKGMKRFSLRKRKRSLRKEKLALQMLL